MSENVEEAVEEESASSPEVPIIPEHLKEPVEKLKEVRLSNAKKIHDLDSMAQTDIRLMLTMVRLNLLIDRILGDGEDRLFFELLFEQNVAPIIDEYLSQAIQAKLLQR